MRAEGTGGNPEAHDLNEKLFSREQLIEILDAVGDRDLHVTGAGESKKYNFSSGDTINALVDIIDNDNNGDSDNRDRWMISLHQL